MLCMHVAYLAMTQQGCSQKGFCQHGVPQFLQWITCTGCRVHAQRKPTGLDGTSQRLQLTADHATKVSR